MLGDRVTMYVQGQTAIQIMLFYVPKQFHIFIQELVWKHWTLNHNWLSDYHNIRVSPIGGGGGLGVRGQRLGGGGGWGGGGSRDWGGGHFPPFPPLGNLTNPLPKFFSYRCPTSLVLESLLANLSISHFFLWSVNHTGILTTNKT